MPRMVRFVRFGDPDVLEVATVDPPHPGAGQVRVRAVIAGLNHADLKILRGGAAAERRGVNPPSGNGNDFAGVIDEVGRGVSAFAMGDYVFGGARMRAQADFVIADAERLLPIPDGLAIEQAGALETVGRAAWASVAAITPAPADTILVSAAAGGVGVLAAQLALSAGATVIGTAGEANHAFLRELGVIPVRYGAGLADRVRSVAPHGITAVLDNHGAQTIDAALELGVPPERINTIAARDHRADLGIRTVGGSAATLRDLSVLAGLIAGGDILLPIDSVYPMERVGDAYRHLLGGHLRGKVVLAME